MATITVTQDEDYRDNLLFNIDAITFNTPDPSATATFSSTQFAQNGGAIADNVVITGDSNQNLVFVFMSAPGTFSAAGWQFANWSGGDLDFAAIGGTNGVDTITAAASPGTNFFVRGGLGADILYAGSDGTTFSYDAGDIVAGEQIYGGSGQDAIRPESNGGGGTDYDFRLVNMTSVEVLQMDIGVTDGIARVTLAGSQIGASGINIVSSSAILHDALIVRGAAVNLAGVTFPNWTNDDDDIRIVGTKKANTLVGSIKDDDIVGGRGRDQLTGGGDDDNFVFNTKADSTPGAKHRDTILDFVQGADLINLAGVDANSNKGGNQFFSFIGAAKFHHKAGELRVTHNATSDIAMVSGDTNGDGKADFQIKVLTPVTLLATDFAL
jgi:hypothetical protein